jgi:hypothetical protein
MNMGLKEKTDEVLKHLSAVKHDELTGASLEQYATTEEKSTEGIVTAIQFDFYFLKFISETMLREYISSVIRHEADGKIDVALFISNDIALETSSLTDPTSPTNPTSPTSPTNPTNPTDPTSPSTSTPLPTPEETLETQVK